MKTIGVTKFQIGKNGITEGTIASLANTFKNHNLVRISVLKSSGRTRESIRQLAAEIEEKMPLKTTAHVIGFTIILKKGRSKNTSKVG